MTDTKTPGEHVDMQLAGLRTLYQHHMRFLTDVAREAARLSGEAERDDRPELSGLTEEWLAGMGRAREMPADALRAEFAADPPGRVVGWPRPDGRA